MQNIPEQFQGSIALQFIQSRGWNWKIASEPNIVLEACPHCQKSDHCYMEIHGAADPQKQRDGLYQCHRCGKGGNLFSLKQHLGLGGIAGVESQKEWAGSAKEPEALPDIDACHQALLEDADAMDYFMNGRGFSREIIERTKLGIVPKRYFKETGEVKAIVYPYLVNGNQVFCHYRTLPTMPLSENKVIKAFSSPKNWDVPLFNQEVLRPGLKEIIMVEGEPNCIAAMDHGIENICGVPGASIKKAEWIDVLDKLELDKILICYDKDKTGMREAQALASRIGVERCWKIVLPDFEVVTETGETRKGKDLNEWFVQGGGTAEKFEELKNEAELFDVDGVSSSKDAIDEFIEDIEGNGVEPKYKTQWPDLNNYVGFDDGDVIDILAPEKIGKTTFAMNLVEHMVDTYGDDGVIICLEMSRKRLARKYVAHVGQVADTIPRTPEQITALKSAFLEAAPLVKAKVANREGDLYFCSPRYNAVEDIYKLIIEIIRRYGVKWIVLDNLQLLADTTPKGKSNRSEHLSAISKQTAKIAKEYLVQMVRILQPHRIGNGQIGTTDNIDGSAAIAKDCDCNISLHRERANQVTKEVLQTMVHVESEAAFSDNTLVTVGLSRYSSGGYTTLICDGARSTFNNRDEMQKIKAQAAVQSTGYDGVMKAMNIQAPAAATPVQEGGNNEEVIAV